MNRRVGDHDQVYDKWLNGLNRMRKKFGFKLF